MQCVIPIHIKIWCSMKVINSKSINCFINIHTENPSARIIKKKLVPDFGAISPNSLSLINCLLFD